MKILFVTAEVGPFVSVGGLSQVSYFLPNSLGKLGEDVRIFTPKFGAMDSTNKNKTSWNLKMEQVGLRVPVNDNPSEDDLICNIKSYEAKGLAKTYFLENREYYEMRANVFGYKDDHVRFALMCKGCLEWLLIEKDNNGWWPDVIHCNDWHAAYLIEMARKSPRYKQAFEGVKIVLTVHNFVYQGNYDYKYCRVDERDDGSKSLLGFYNPELQKQNALLRGILYADEISTVSPTHAKEVLTEEYGEGLQKALLKKKDRLSGILNGLDVTTFDPSKDKLLKTKFGIENFEQAREINKKEVQELFGLAPEKNNFLLAYVGRLAQQKGLTMIIGMLPHLLLEHPKIQIIFLGGGEDAFRHQLTQLKEKFPKQIGLHLLPDFKMPRKIFAGADALLLPSIFEPGGIVALEALRYGAVPIVRRTGGLADIVQDFNPDGKGNGFSFQGKSEWSLYGSIIEALTTYANKKLWKTLIKNCLEADFSWDFVAKEYQKWYRRVSIKE